MAKKKEKPENPLDSKEDAEKKESALIENIVSTETSEGEEEKILGEAPKVDPSLLMEAEPRKSILLVLVKIFFSLLFFASVGSVLFFTSQLTTRFEFLAANVGLPSAFKELSTTNSEIIRIQTDINLHRHLQIKHFLDEFSYYGDSFIRNYDTAGSQTSSPAERARASAALQEDRERLAEAFISSRELIANPIHVPLFDPEHPDERSLILLFTDRLRNSVIDRVQEKNRAGMLSIVGNMELRNLLIRTDFDALTDTELYSLVNQINSLIVNEMSIIQKINRQRIRWSDIINEIELRTRSVDEYYSDAHFEAVGGIRYTSFDFDASNRRISIVGETKTFSTATFTMIANLIDELNSSEMFESGEMRSFSKSGSFADGYTGSLRLSLDLVDNITITD